MLGLDALDVAIGVVFLFLLTSLICSAISEMIEAVVHARAAKIEAGLRELLNDDKGAFLRQLYGHPLIDGLFRGDYDPSKLAGGRWNLSVLRGRNLPSYIPAASFARALIDVTVRGDPSVAAPPTPLTLDALRREAARLPSPRLQRALLTAIDAGEGDLRAVQANLETWFDTAMDRVSGGYKRRTGIILFWLGLACAGVLNLDAIAVGVRLGADHTLRQRFIAEAESVAALDCRIPTNAGSPLCTPGTARVAALSKELRGLDAPVGWSQANRPEDRLGWLTKLAGWLITAFAVTLGAPFWFDTLNRFMIVRSTIKPAQKSGEDAPIEPQARAGPRPGGPPPQSPSPPGGASTGSGGGPPSNPGGPAGPARAARASSPPLPLDADALDAPPAPLTSSAGDEVRAAAAAEALNDVPPVKGNLP